jgi:hypothetical protein
VTKSEQPLGKSVLNSEMFADSPTLTAHHRYLTSVTFSDVGLSAKVSNPIGQTLCRSWAVNREVSKLSKLPNGEKDIISSFGRF